MLCQCLQGAPIPAPGSADAALLHLLLALGLFIPLLGQAFSNTPTASKTLLPQVGDIPIWVGFADRAGPRGCYPILMNSLQGPDKHRVCSTNIYCAWLCSASSRAACPWLRHWVCVDTASFPWGLLSAKSFRAANYHFSSRNLPFFFFVLFFLFIFFLQRECC